MAGDLAWPSVHSRRAPCGLCVGSLSLTSPAKGNMSLFFLNTCEDNGGVKIV